METVRFSVIVAKCGQPKAHTQWLPLEKDEELKKAAEDERVLTVHLQNVGTKKDHGEIGLLKKGQRALLIFPKTLRRFAGKRVVGINYDLLRNDMPAEPPAAPKTHEKKSRSEPETKLKLVKEKPVKNAKAARSKPPPQTSSPPAKKTVKAHKEKAAQTAKASSSADLQSVIRKALKQLAQGKEVAAYQTLQNGLTE